MLDEIVGCSKIAGQQANSQVLTGGKKDDRSTA